MSDLEWRTLMVGAVVMDSSTEVTSETEKKEGSGGGSAARSKPLALSWLPAKSWDQLLAYEATLGPSFEGLPRAIESAPEAWKVKPTR